MRWLSVILAVLLTTASASLAAQGHVTGTASYRERIALPPGAVFEAVIEDASLADAPAQVLGHTTIEDPGNPPFVFDIAFDPTEIDPGKTYGVRTQVSVGRRIIFVSDTLQPVLTQGAPDDVQIWMIKVGDTGAEAREAPTAIGAHGLRLPASFSGDLPCADCEGVGYLLNLWPDQVFQLRRSWKGEDKIRDSIGRWSVDPDSQMLDLRGADEELRFRILGSDRLELLGRDGKPIDSALDYTLRAENDLEPIEPHLPLRGMLTFVADQARFTECLTGRDFPLVEDGDFAALEHAYLAAGAEAGGPIMASFDGAILQEPKPEGEGTEPMVLVERFVGIWPGETCERSTGAATLTNTYWKILRLGDTEVAAGANRREPNLILRAGAPRFTATIGCNQIGGSYALDGDTLTLDPGAATPMACPAPLDDWERQLAEVLKTTTGWRIDGQTLELLDAGGNTLALLQAVYLY